MAAKLSDAEFIERHRAANRLRSERQRERRCGAGRVALTVWIREQTKAHLMALATAENTPVAEVADRLLSAALSPTAIPVTPAPADPDNLPLFEPESTDSKPVESDSHLERRIMELKSQGLSSREIARQAGCGKTKVLKTIRLNQNP